MRSIWLAIAGLAAWAAISGAAEPEQAAKRVAEARRELLGEIAPSNPGAYEDRLSPAGEYIYEASTAKPLVEGGRCEVQIDKPVKGLTVVQMDGSVWRMPDMVSNAGVYWTLGGIEPGAYWVGVWYRSDNADREASQSWYAPVQVYLNGRMVQLATHGDPVQVAPGVYFTEALAADAVALQPGDELAVGRNHGGAVARVVLKKKAPAAGPHRIATNFGGHQWNPYTALGVNVDAVFLNRDGKAVDYVNANSSNERRAFNRAALVDGDGRARVNFVFSNPLPIPVTVTYDCVVRSYFFAVAAREEGKLELAPHACVVKTLTYEWADAEPAYLAFANVRGVNLPAYSEPREKGGLGWPAHEVYSYFPGQRHALPWPDPYAYRVLRRLTLAKTGLGLHDVMSLDQPKEWERALTSELEPVMPPPAGLEFKKVRLPYREGLEGIVPRPHGAYLRCSFILPEALAGRSYRLTLASVQDEATAYVNGRKVGNVRGGNTPLYADITSAARPGTNELIVVVRDLIAIMNPDYVDRDNPVANPSYLDAPGLFGANGLALFGASIESGPAVSAEEIFVVTSTRRKTVTARLSVGNRSDGAVRAIVKATVLDEGRPILAVGEKALDLAAGQTLELALEAPWANPRFWGPADPHLYALAVEVLDAQSGARLDFQRERFGFRESWIDGPYIMFNGEPIRPKGAARIMRQDPDGDFRFARGSWGDWSDETGMLGGCSITEIRNNMSQHNATREEFWKSATENALVAMKKWRNHPSVQAWDLSNEWLCFAAPLVNDIMVPARHMKRLSDTLRAADPSRWTFFNGDEDLHGLLDNFSFHYISPYRHSLGFGMRGHSDYFPDAEYWRPLDRLFEPGEEFPLNPFHNNVILSRDKKVMMNNEHLWKCGDLMPPGPTLWVGEDDVLSPAVDNGSGPIAWMWKNKIDGNRDLGVAPVNNIYGYHPGVQRGGYLEQTFILPENQRRAFAGRTETRRFVLLNGKFRTEEFVFAWALKTPGGKVAQSGEFKRTMPSGGHEGGTFAFKVPDVREPTVYTLVASLTVGGRFATAEEWDIEVWPDRPIAAGALARRVVLFDPAGTTAQALARAGVRFEKADHPGAPAGAPADTLLILGEDALDETNAGQTAALADFTEKGGRVLVLRQTVAPAHLPVVTKLEARQWMSQVFVRMGDHPLMQGLDSMDLHFWQPDRAVATGSYTKPSSGNCVVLADSGGNLGMEQAHLLELYRGEGAYLLCQIPAAGRYDVEPMARELFGRLVRYAGGRDAFARPTGNLVLAAAEGSRLAPRLADMEVSVENLAPETAWDGTAPLMIEAAAGRAATPERLAEWAGKLAAGGRVVVVNATPDDQAWLSRLAGAEVRIGVPPYRMWEGRGYRRGWPRWTAGLSHLDLYWKRFDGGELAGQQLDDPSYTIEPLQDYAASIDGGRELVFPGALAELGVGGGVLLIDQRRWWTPHPSLLTHALRNLSALLTGLNVRIPPVVPPPALPEGIAYRTIDITPYANRGLADETAEDGKGGWTDQGPRCDLRVFPTGPQLFQGVPFVIGSEPNVCIVLGCGHRPGFDTMPRDVALPVGYPVEGLFFLHSTAWGGRPTAVYTIEYEDGESVSIPLMAGENIYDWANPRPFLREKGTQSVIAWTGRNDVFPIVGVFRMLWVNPRPEVAVKAVRFHKKEGSYGGVPVLVGMSAAVRRDAADTAGIAEVRARMDEAERAKDDERVLAAAWDWGLRDPAAAAPWARIGEIKERRGDKRGALEAYKKSLSVEWNQPPVMNAVRQLEEALANTPG